MTNHAQDMVRIYAIKDDLRNIASAIREMELKEDLNPLAEKTLQRLKNNQKQLLAELGTLTDKVEFFKKPKRQRRNRA